VKAARARADPAGRPVRVVFITNRECAKRPGNDDPCPQKADTAANLAALGLPTADADLLLRGERPEWDGEKFPRRALVAAGSRIVLNVGDDLADFLPGARRQGIAERDRARCALDAWWGTRWFALPNPIYGSWLVAAGDDLTEALAAKPGVFQACPQD
jgi:acid phosphatase